MTDKTKQTKSLAEIAAEIEEERREEAKRFIQNAMKTKQVGGTHYVDMQVQPWEAMQAWLSQEEFEGYLRGSVIKYIARAGKKGDAQDALNDLKKAMHYMEKLLEVVDAA